MELLHNLGIGFGVAFTLTNLLYAFGGAVLGTLIGVLPGIGPVATIAMLLPATYALPPVAAPHDHIVNVDQWPAGKGRKTFYAIDQPDRLLPIQRENAERLGPRSQRCHQVFPRISRQRCATAGRVARIGVKQFDNGPSLPRFLVIRDKNKNGAHPQSVKHNAPMTERTKAPSTKGSTGSGSSWPKRPSGMSMLSRCL